MCGRFGLANPHRLKAAGAFDAVLPDRVSDAAAALLAGPRFNVAPGDPVAAARTRVPSAGERDPDGAPRGPERRVDAFRWGLIPAWAKDPAIGNRLALARAETIAELPSFRGPWRAGRRCLVFVDVIYEWRDAEDATADPRNGDALDGSLGDVSREASRASVDAPSDALVGRAGRRRVARAPKPHKQPYAVRLHGEAPFALGGIWEAWRDPAVTRAAARVGGRGAPAPWVPTCALITTPANAVMRPIHDRMPVIVPPAAYDAWLDPALPLDRARALLAPFAPDAMCAYPVSTALNNPKYDVPELLDPLAGVPNVGVPGVGAGSR